MAQERAGAFNFWGPKTLVGPELKPGDTAPDFTVVNGKGEEVQGASFVGTPLVISVVPSLDTSVCSLQTRRFDREAAGYGERLKVLTISADLPFAQGRWVSAEGAEHVTVLSDYRYMSFGDAFGTHVKELRLDSRAVFVVDQDGVVRYAEYVPVAGNEPNYDAALEAIKQVVK